MCHARVYIRVESMCRPGTLFVVVTTAGVVVISSSFREGTRSAAGMHAIFLQSENQSLLVASPERCICRITMCHTRVDLRLCVTL